MVEEIQIDKEEKNKRALLVTVIVLIILFILGYIVLMVDERKALMTHSPQTLETYMENCINEDFEVWFDIYAYMPGEILGEDLPYKGKVVYEDGSELEFKIYWSKKGLFDIRSDYEEKMVRHYAQKYGFSFEDENVWYWIRFKDSDIEGENAKLYQFLTELENSGYIQAGQELALYLELEKEEGYAISKYISMSLEEPVDFEDIKKELTE